MATRFECRPDPAQRYLFTVTYRDLVADHMGTMRTFILNS